MICSVYHSTGVTQEEHYQFLDNISELYDGANGLIIAGCDANASLGTDIQQHTMMMNLKRLDMCLDHLGMNTLIREGSNHRMCWQQKSVCGNHVQTTQEVRYVGVQLHTIRQERVPTRPFFHLEQSKAKYHRCKKGSRQSQV